MSFNELSYLWPLGLPSATPAFDHWFPATDLGTQVHPNLQVLRQIKVKGAILLKKIKLLKTYVRKNLLLSLITVLVLILTCKFSAKVRNFHDG